MNNNRRRRSAQISKSKIVNYFKNEVETINFKKPEEPEEDEKDKSQDKEEENKEEPADLTYRTRLRRDE